MNKKILNDLIEKYGGNMRLKEMAAVLRLTPETIRNKIWDGTFPIPTWKVGRYRLASTYEVAEYISSQQDQAKQELEHTRKNLNLL